MPSAMFWNLLPFLDVCKLVPAINVGWIRCDERNERRDSHRSQGLQTINARDGALRHKLDLGSILMSNIMPTS